MLCAVFLQARLSMQQRRCRFALFKALSHHLFLANQPIKLGRAQDAGRVLAGGRRAEPEKRDRKHSWLG